jgi:hypothetical protein
MDPAPLDITWGSGLPVKAGKEHDKPGFSNNL